MSQEEPPAPFTEQQVKWIDVHIKNHLFVITIPMRVRFYMVLLAFIIGASLAMYAYQTTQNNTAQLAAKLCKNQNHSKQALKDVAQAEVDFIGFLAGITVKSQGHPLTKEQQTSLVFLKHKQTERLKRALTIQLTVCN